MRCASPAQRPGSDAVTAHFVGKRESGAQPALKPHPNWRFKTLRLCEPYVLISRKYDHNILDPEAGTLYWYFTELIAGSTADEAECAATLLLDADGQVIGVELELDQQIKRKHLALALAHPQVSHSQSDYTLTVQVAEEEPAEAQPLHEPAILDFDAAGRLQGCEILAAEEFGLAERLARLAPFMVSIEDEDEEGDGRDGPVVFTGLPTTEQSEAPTVPSQPVSEHFRTGFVDARRPAQRRQVHLAQRAARPEGRDRLAQATDDPYGAARHPVAARRPGHLCGHAGDPRPAHPAWHVYGRSGAPHHPRRRCGLLLVDITQPPGHLDRRIADLVRRSRAPRMLVLNKVDRLSPQGQMHMEAYRALGPWDMEVAVSALKREGLETLVDEIVGRLPLGPPHYPTDQLTDQSAREQVAELVREQVLRSTGQEVPHGVAIEIEEWEEKAAGDLYPRDDLCREGIPEGHPDRRGRHDAQAHRQQRALWHRGGAGPAGRSSIYGSSHARNWRDDPASLHWLGYE